MAKFENDFATVEFRDKNLKKFLEGLSRRQKDIAQRDKAFIKVLMVHIMRDIDDHFEKETGPRGKWKKWSVNYLDAITGRARFMTVNGRTIRIDLTDPANDEWNLPKGRRPRKGEIGPKLRDTGRLQKGLKPKNWRKQKSGILVFNNAKVKGGFPYAYAHNKGGSKLPQREFMWLSKKGMKFIAREAALFMKGKD